MRCVLQIVYIYVDNSIIIHCYKIVLAFQCDLYWKYHIFTICFFFVFCFQKESNLWKNSKVDMKIIHLLKMQAIVFVRPLDSIYCLFVLFFHFNLDIFFCSKVAFVQMSHFSIEMRLILLWRIKYKPVLEHTFIHEKKTTWFFFRCCRISSLLW